MIYENDYKDYSSQAILLLFIVYCYYNYSKNLLYPMFIHSISQISLLSSNIKEEVFEILSQLFQDLFMNFNNQMNLKISSLIALPLFTKKKYRKKELDLSILYRAYIIPYVFFSVIVNIFSILSKLIIKDLLEEKVGMNKVFFDWLYFHKEYDFINLSDGFYYSPRLLKQIVRAAKNYHKITNEIFPHSLVTGPKKILILFLFALTNMMPNTKFNMINIFNNSQPEENKYLEKKMIQSLDYNRPEDFAPFIKKFSSIALFAKNIKDSITNAYNVELNLLAHVYNIDFLGKRQISNFHQSLTISNLLRLQMFSEKNKIYIFHSSDNKVDPALLSRFLQRINHNETTEEKLKSLLIYIRRESLRDSRFFNFFCNSLNKTNVMFIIAQQLFNKGGNVFENFQKFVLAFFPTDLKTIQNRISTMNEKN